MGSLTDGVARVTAVGILLIGIVMMRLLSASASATAPVAGSSAPPGGGPVLRASVPGAAPSLGDARRGQLGRAGSVGGAITTDDGVLPDGVTVFESEYPGIARLKADLLAALRDAAAEAEADGIQLFVSSGWRSPAYQDELLRDAVIQYGSEEEAARWVATSQTSPHVAGEAVDIATPEEWAWLSEHGARNGLCQIYRNEPWHYELRPRAIERGCPRMYADPTQDPRMRQ